MEENIRNEMQVLIEEMEERLEKKFGSKIETLEKELKKLKDLKEVVIEPAKPSSAKKFLKD
jgi:hypothetical protein